MWLNLIHMDDHSTYVEEANIGDVLIRVGNYSRIYLLVYIDTTNDNIDLLEYRPS